MVWFSATDRYRGRLGDLKHFVEKHGPRYHLHFLTFHLSRSQFSSEDSLAPIDGVLRPCLLMVPDLLLPLRSTDLLDTLEVSVPLLTVVTVRDHRAHPRRNDDFDFPLGRFCIHGGVIEGSVRSDSLDAMSYLLEQSGEDLGIMNGPLGELGGDDESTGLNGQMKLLPSLRPSTAMFGGGPLSLPKDLETGRVEKHVKGSVLGELGLKRELELLTSSNQRGMVRNVKVAEAEKLEKRPDEAFGLAPRQGVLETKKESELDDGIRVPPRSASLAGLSRLPRAKKVGRKMEGQGATLNKAALVGSPVGNPIPGLVRGVDLRALHRAGILSRPLGPVHRKVHQRLLGSYAVRASSAVRWVPSIEKCTNADR